MEKKWKIFIFYYNFRLLTYREYKDIAYQIKNDLNGVVKMKSGIGE